MNKVILMGRLTRDIEIRYSAVNPDMAIGKFSLAVARKSKKEETDFINCIAFGKTAEVIEKYVHKGERILISGHIQTGKYTNQSGQNIYTTDVVVDELSFIESKSNSSTAPQKDMQPGDEFMQVPEDVEDDLPF